MIKIDEQFTELILHDFTLNKAQCKILNIDFPLQEGWETKLLEQKLSENNITLLILLKGKLALKAQEQIIKNFSSLNQYLKTITGYQELNENYCEKKDEVIIYCDGACQGNPGKAGSGITLYSNGKTTLYYGLFLELGTNNIAELCALHQSLLIAEKAMKASIYSDSTYAIDCITKWAYKWKKDDWTKKNGEIKNLKIIKEMHNLYDSIKDKIIIKHVKAHSGIEGNELADRMAVHAIKLKEKKFVKFNFDNISEILGMESY